MSLSHMDYFIFDVMFFWFCMFFIVLQSLSHCELITDEGIRHVGMSPCAAEHLAVLELDNCPLITDAALDNLISCHSLQRIELYDCQLITRAGIRRLRVWKRYYFHFSNLSNIHNSRFYQIELLTERSRSCLLRSSHSASVCRRLSPAILSLLRNPLRTPSNSIQFQSSSVAWSASQIFFNKIWLLVT